MKRRDFLKSAVIGCSAAASPLLTPVTFAAAPWDARLVVIILRGAMDGLDAVQPIGDPDFAGLRPNLPPPGQPLDGFFALHPALEPLRPMWDAGDLAFAHAVSTPYRDKRSHFDGQDLLEAGVPSLDGGLPKDGWLNRMLQVMPGIETETAFAVGREDMRLLRGRAPTSNWSPTTLLNLSPQAERLLKLIYHDDPLFRDAAEAATQILASMAAERDMGDDADMGAMASMMEEVSNQGLTRIAEFAVGRLRLDTRIASFSLGGWDTHAGQRGQISRRFRELSEVLNVLKTGLGPVWDKTTVLAITEFGRTARENGTGGTDHGTGSAMVMAGGAVRGRRVYGEWPGLAEADLYDRRDLMPTRDVRAYAGWAMRDLMGAGASDIERVIFPGLDLGPNPGFIL